MSEETPLGAVARRRRRWDHDIRELPMAHQLESEAIEQRLSNT
jgi:hypothetical protein